MHAFSAALLGLLLATSPALAAKPGERGSGAAPQRAKASAPAASSSAAAGRQVQPGVVRQATAAAPRLKAAPARAQAGRAAAPIRGRMVVSSTRSAAIAVGTGCSSGRGGARSCRAPRMNWAEGLSPAAGVQAAECPAGTMATLATGHSDVVRCMPI
jgi:hypothetical protein